MSIANPYHLGNMYNGITKVHPLLYKYQYILQFVNGGGWWENGVFKKFTLFDNDPDHPDQNFSYWAQSATIPQFEIPAAKVNFYSNDFRVPGCVTYQHDFRTKIFLDQDLTMYKKLDTWMKLISRLQLSGGGIKVIPTIKLRIKLLDSEHEFFTTSFVMEGVWINDLDKLTLGYKGSGASTKIEPNVSFKMQYYYRDDDCDLTMDPLSASKIAAAYGAV